MSEALSSSEGESATAGVRAAVDQPAEGGGEGKMRQGAALLRGLSSGTVVHSCCAGPRARPGAPRCARRSPGSQGAPVPVVGADTGRHRRH